MVIDSGKGGLNVLKSLQNMSFPCDFYYLSDSRSAPYGERSEAFLLARARELIKKYAKGFSAVIFACNTLSTVVAEKLQSELPIKIFGIYPDEPVGKTLLLCTPATAASERVNTMRRAFDLTVCAPEGLVAAIEKNISYIMKGDFSPVENLLPANCGYDSVLLGCTHFIFLTDLVKKTYRGAMVFDGVSTLKRTLSEYFVKSQEILTTINSSGFIDKNRFLGYDKAVNYAIFKKMTAFY